MEKLVKQEIGRCVLCAAFALAKKETPRKTRHNKELLCSSPNTINPPRNFLLQPSMTSGKLPQIMIIRIVIITQNSCQFQDPVRHRAEWLSNFSL